MHKQQVASACSNTITRTELQIELVQSMQQKKANTMMQQTPTRMILTVKIP